MMRLSELLDALPPETADVTIKGLALHSSDIKPGYAFLAVAGYKEHALKYLPIAIDKGATVILYDPRNSEPYLMNHDVPCLLLKVEKLEKQISDISGRYYKHPSRNLQVIGITGTNGKTSCSHFLAQAMSDCAVVGTLGWGKVTALNTTINTTPDAVSIQQIMHTLFNQNFAAVAMEVSSHGLHQGRVAAVHFTGAVFTNISRDHLDYHKTMQSYVAAKQMLFSTPDLAFAVVNLDDPYSQQIIQCTPKGTRIWGFSMQGKHCRQGYSLQQSNIRNKDTGIAFNVQFDDQSAEVNAPVFGEFNAQNLMAVLVTLVACGYPLQEAARRLQKVSGIKGRMQKFTASGKAVTYIDFAHTPDALEKVLHGLKKQCPGKLWLVFGCGGNRDQGKRPLMGQVAEQLADAIVLTDDNPRYEASAEIINDIRSGMSADTTTVIPDRSQAIAWALEHAHQNDILLIAGKGHEAYQEIQGVKRSYSDAQVIEQCFSAAQQEKQPCA